MIVPLIILCVLIVWKTGDGQLWDRDTRERDRNNMILILASFTVVLILFLHELCVYGQQFAWTFNPKLGGTHVDLMDHDFYADLPHK
jgi:hypothetical protein